MILISKVKFEEEFKCVIKTAVKQLLNVANQVIIFFKEISLLVKLVELYGKLNKLVI